MITILMFNLKHLKSVNLSFSRLTIVLTFTLKKLKVLGNNEYRNIFNRKHFQKILYDTKQCFCHTTIH